jgi:hypothetical protein
MKMAINKPNKVWHSAAAINQEIFLTVTVAIRIKVIRTREDGF